MSQKVQKPVPTKDNVTFDFSEFRARDADAMRKKGDDLAEVAAVLARCVVVAPVEWGRIDDPDTYLDLPTKTHWNPLVNSFFDELNGKN